MAVPAWSKLEEAIGHVFARRRRLEQALTHSSLAYERAGVRSEGSVPGPKARQPLVVPKNAAKSSQADDAQDNEKMEFLGDAVLGLIVADCLFRSYPALNEGDLTRLRAQLVSRRHLGQVGAKLSLGDYIRLGRGEERSGGRQKSVLLANALEAVIAALYLDGGLPVATGFVGRWIIDPYLPELHSALEAGQAMGDHKSALQEWLQAHKAGTPHYTVKAESGPDHRKRFLVEVQVLGKDHGRDPVIAEGAGSTKKRAEQEAARLAYSALLERAEAATVPSDCAGKVS